MGDQIIRGLKNNTSLYTGLLIIGEILTGLCIEKKFISKLEIGEIYKLKCFTHVPSISCYDMCWNKELNNLREEYCGIKHQISQLLFINTKLVNNVSIVEDINEILQFNNDNYITIYYFFK